MFLFLLESLKYLNVSLWYYFIYSKCKGMQISKYLYKKFLNIYSIFFITIFRKFSLQNNNNNAFNYLLKIAYFRALEPALAIFTNTSFLSTYCFFLLHIFLSL